MTVHPSAPGDLKWHVSLTCDGGACVMVARDGDSVVFGNGAQPQNRRPPMGQVAHASVRMVRLIDSHCVTSGNGAGDRPIGPRL